MNRRKRSVVAENVAGSFRLILDSAVVLLIKIIIHLTSDFEWLHCGRDVFFSLYAFFKVLLEQWIYTV